jgi:phospholipid/cholesterol/gamma-HCH transport system substrate-binding protein
MSISASQRARLGVFLVAGAALIAVFVAIPVGLQLTHRQKNYYAYFLDESISGLEQGADVKFRGVPVGKVVRIRYDRTDLSRVRVDVRVEHDFPLTEDMVGQIGGLSLTGIKHMELGGGTNSSPLRAEGTEIPTKQSVMATLTGKAEEIILKIEVLLNHLNGLTHPDSSLGTILENVAEITAEAKGFVAAVRPKVERSAGSFTSLMNRIDSISQDVKVITALVIRQSREDIMVAMENLREALENANELTKILAENPSLLLRGEQQRERELQ